MSATLEAIRYVSDASEHEGRTKSNRLDILDQLLLPDATEYLVIQGVDDGWRVIRNMNVSTSCTVKQ